MAEGMVGTWFTCWLVGPGSRRVKKGNVSRSGLLPLGPEDPAASCGRHHTEKPAAQYAACNRWCVCKALP